MEFPNDYRTKDWYPQAWERHDLGIGLSHWTCSVDVIRDAHRLLYNRGVWSREECQTNSLHAKDGTWVPEEYLKSEERYRRLKESRHLSVDFRANGYGTPPDELIDGEGLLKDRSYSRQQVRLIMNDFVVIPEEKSKKRKTDAAGSSCWTPVAGSSSKCELLGQLVRICHWIQQLVQQLVQQLE